MVNVIPVSKHPIENYFDKISRYHYVFFFCLFLSKFFVIWHVLNVIFLSPPMEYECNGKKNDCPCENPKWNTRVFTSTMQTKYGLICEKKWLIGFSHSMMYLGGVVGALLIGFLSDRYGRLTMYTISMFIMGVFGCLIMYMPNIATCICMRMLEGVGFGGAVVTGYVLCVEFCGVRHREMVSALFHIPINLGHMCLPGVSYFLRDCKDFQLAISIPMFFFMTLKVFFLESPKWLLDSHQVDKATMAMSKFSHFNKTPSGPIRDEIQAYQGGRDKEKDQKMRFWKIFSHRRLTVNFACMTVIYYTCGMGYYGVSQFIGQMSGNIHVNVAMSGALLLPGTIIACFLLQMLSRRAFLMSTSFLSGIIMLIVVFTSAEYAWIRVILACICNACFFMSFITVFLYGVELFPTALRSSVLGVLSLMSRAGQMSAPLINILPPKTSGIIFGALALAGGFLCIPLPETKNIELPSSLEESAAIGKK